MRDHPREMSPGLLDKVRALLAKAESTPFEAEADALTAKAQELMARHRIERVMLDADDDTSSGQPITRRVPVGDPYASAKSYLLACIADANGCRSVWAHGERCSYLFGFDFDVAVVDELFASLLVQATAALRREGTKRDAFGRNRTKRFRRAFLLAYAVRIGQRLRDVVDATVDDVSTTSGTVLVPLFTERLAATEAAARAAFPETRTMTASVSDGEGWRAGTEVADRANLRVGRDQRLTA